MKCGGVDDARWDRKRHTGISRSRNSTLSTFQLPYSMRNKHYKHLFGPVPSRRLGRSLGVDLTPFKTCSFDCIFCQLGRTTRKTLRRKEYVPVDKVIAELDEWLKTGDQADYITLSGSGEPTLNSEFGRVIEFARNATSIPVALLTNGSLLGDPEVRAQAARADVVKVSLSAWDSFSFAHINRPHADIGFKQLIEGQWLLRKQFKGEIWMEVFLVWGTNTTPREVSKIAELVKTLGPDKVQLNTAVRPPCEEFAHAVPQDQMGALAKLFDPPGEVVAEYSKDTSAKVCANEEDILEMLERRPCTLNQICRVFGLHRNEASKYLGKLVRTGSVRELRKENEVYYSGVHGEEALHNGPHATGVFSFRRRAETEKMQRKRQQTEPAVETDSTQWLLQLPVERVERARRRSP